MSSSTSLFLATDIPAFGTLISDVLGMLENKKLCLSISPYQSVLITLRLISPPQEVSSG